MTATLPFMRNSERSSFKECPQQWYWAWEMGLVPRMPKLDARWFGTGIHLALAEWYMPEGAKNGFARGADPRETFEKYCGGIYSTVAAQPYFGEEAEKEYLDARILGGDMLAGYVEHYDGTDPTIEVLFPEYRYAMKIPFNARQKAAIVSGDLSGLTVGEKFIVIMVGTFDMVFRDHTYGNPVVKVIDHKTAKQKTSGAHLVKDDQAGTYIAVATSVLKAKGVIGPKEAVAGMTYNYLRKSRRNPDDVVDEQGRKRNLPTVANYAEALAQRGCGIASELEKLKKPTLVQMAEKFAATDPTFKVYGAVSKVQPAPLFWRDDVMRSTKNRANQVRRIADDAEMIARVRSGGLPILKTPGEHCAWCDFRDLCDIHEDGEDVEGFIKDVFVQRDPYADHREGAENSKTSVTADKTVKSNVTRVDFGMGK